MLSGLRLLARGLAHNLGAGLRLAFFLPLGVSAFRIGPGHFATLVLFNVGAWLCSDVLFNGREAALNPSALVHYLAQLTLVLLATTIIGGVYGQPGLALRLALLWYAPDVVFEAADVLVAAQTGAAALVPAVVELPDWFAESFGWMAAAWQLAIMVRAIGVATGRRSWRIVPSVVVLLALSVAVANLLPRAELWRPELRDEREEEEEDDPSQQHHRASRPAAPSA